jgi:hypothetical protein
MPRLVHAVPKYQKHRASGQAVVPINGRDYYLGPHGARASKIEYERLITEYLSSGRTASFGAPQEAITIVELLADYVKHAASYGKSKRGEYAQVVRAVRPLKELYGCTAAEDFGVPSSRPSGITSRRPAGTAATSMRSWAGSCGSLSGPLPRGGFRRPFLRLWP